jgi:hypothetical protein
MDEYNSIIRNKTFSLTQAQLGNKPIESKWVFTINRNPDGSTGYKARLVIKGYEQMDYGEMYAPVGKLTTFRLLIILAARNNCKIDRLDVVMAFPNPDVDDNTLFMELPEEWPEDRPNSGLDKVTVVRLRKALYGLKQTPHLASKQKLIPTSIYDTSAKCSYFSMLTICSWLTHQLQQMRRRRSRRPKLLPTRSPASKLLANSSESTSTTKVTAYRLVKECSLIAYSNNFIWKQLTVLQLHLITKLS